MAAAIGNLKVSKSVNYFFKYDFLKGNSSGSVTCRVYDIQTTLFIFDTLQILIKVLPTVLILIIALFYVFFNRIDKTSFSSVMDSRIFFF